MSRARLLASFARRFARDRSAASGALVLSLTSALLVTLFVTLQAMSLSGDQEIERTLGRFDYVTNVIIDRGVGSRDAPLIHRLGEAIESASDGTATLVLTSPDLSPATTSPPTTYYTEAPWVDAPFPDRYELAEGRWPESPGEVVVAATTTGSLAQTGDQLSILAGHASLQVVGRFDDLYGNYEAMILGAPGTWGRLPDQKIQGVREPGALLAIHGREGTRGSVLKAASQVLGENGAERRRALAGLNAETRTAAEVAEDRDRSWVERIPAGYTLPSVLLPGVAVIAVFGFGAARNGRTLRILRSNGVPMRLGAGAITLGVTAWLVAGLLGGVALGAVLSVGVRAYLDSTWYQPLPPFPSLLGPTSRMLLGVVVAAGLYYVSLARARSDGRAPRRSGRVRLPAWASVTNLRHACATIAACACVIGGMTLDTAAGAMIFACAFTAGLLLVIPELTRPALAVGSARGARGRLVRRQLQEHGPRTVGTVTVLAAILAAPLGFLALLSTFIATEATNVAGAEVAPGQVAVSDGGILTPPMSRRVVNTVRSHLPAEATEVQVRYLWGKGGRVAIQGTDVGVVLAVDTPEEASALANRDLSVGEREHLLDGGILVWDAQDGSERTLHDPRSADSSVTLPALESTFPASWSGNRHAIILTQTARAGDLPVKRGAIVFTGVPANAAEAAAQAVLDAGEDPAQVLRYSDTDPPYVPQIIYLTAIGLLVTGLVVGGALARSQVATARPYLATLLAIGLPPRWMTGVLLLQQAWLVGFAMAVAFVCAVVPAIVVATFTPGYVLDVPWQWIGLTLAAFCLPLFSAVLLAMRGIRASHRALS